MAESKLKRSDSIQKVWSPTARLTVFGIQGPELNRETGGRRNDQPPDIGIDFDVHHGATEGRQYDINGEHDRNLFMATLEMAKVRQLQRIARALEKLAGLRNEHDEGLWHRGEPGGVRPPEDDGDGQ